MNVDSARLQMAIVAIRNFMQAHAIDNLDVFPGPLLDL
jgi:hypothetical protein